MDATHERIYRVIRAISAGKVITYGRVARAADLPGQARLVGYALHSLGPDSDVPWHRVVNAKGCISLDTRNGAGQLQRALLKAEGVVFDENGHIDLTKYLAADHDDPYPL